jgi:hypothetical protein
LLSILPLNEADFKYFCNPNQKSEQGVPIFDSACYAGRFLFFRSVPGIFILRASCFNLRLCLRIPLDGRFVLVGVVSN